MMATIALLCLSNTLWPRELRFVHIDAVVRQDSAAQYCARSARSGACRVRAWGAGAPTQMQSTARRALLQHVELMSQYQDFGCQPRPWLEAVAQHTDEQGRLRTFGNHALRSRRVVIAR